MAAVTGSATAVKAKAGPSASKEIFSGARTESRPKSEGFGSQKTVVDTTAAVEASADRVDATIGTSSSPSSTGEADSTEGSHGIAEEESDADSNEAPDGRKKRRKAGRKDKKK